MNWVKRFVLRKAAALLLLIALWECTSSLFPEWPSAIRVGSVVAGLLIDPGFIGALVGSLRRMIIGYSLVVIIGIGVGLLLGRFAWLDELMSSATAAILAIPGAAWVPLAILWFGFTEKAVIFTILLGAAGIVIVNTDSGIRTVPPQIVRAARTMGARGTRFFWHVIVPAATPKIVDGLRLAWAFGWRALMAGELIIAVNGLGRLLSESAKARQLEQLLALMLVVAVIGMLIDGLVFKRLESSVRERWGLGT